MAVLQEIDHELEMERLSKTKSETTFSTLAKAVQVWKIGKKKKKGLEVAFDYI